MAVAAGSGITPVMAIARTVLAANENVRFDLVYANKAAMDVMFLEELADLKDRYPARFALHHVLSREQRISPLLSRPHRRREAGHAARLGHPHRTGRRMVPLRPVRTGPAVPRHPRRPRAWPPRRSASSCSPPASPTARRATSAGPSSSTNPTRPTRSPSRSTACRARSTAPSTPAKPSSTPRCACARTCRSPAPAACAAPAAPRSSTGTVEMDENYALEPDEIEKGYVLTCQSRPTTDRVTGRLRRLGTNHAGKDPSADAGGSLP